MAKKNPYPNCPEKVSKPVRSSDGGYCELDIEINKWMKPNLTVLGIQFLLENKVMIITRKMETISFRANKIKYWNPDAQKMLILNLEQAAFKILSSEMIMFKK